jgi:hypothetical protein
VGFALRRFVEHRDADAAHRQHDVVDMLFVGRRRRDGPRSRTSSDKAVFLAERDQRSDL